MKKHKLSFLVYIVFIIGGTSASAATLESLKKHYPMVIGANNCDSAVVGDKLYGANDGGGAAVTGIKNPVVIDLKTGNKTPLDGYVVRQSAAFSQHYKNLIRLVNTEGMMGLYNLCEGNLTEFKYKEINHFNKDGYAIAFSEKKLYVLDANGKQILKKPFAHNLNLKSFHSVPTYGKGANWQLVNNMIIASHDGVKYGLFNVKSQKAVTSFIYDEIDLFDSEHFIVSKAGKRSLLSNKTGKPIMPFHFNSDLSFIKTSYGGNYILGAIVKNKKTHYNLYSLKDKSLVLGDKLLFNGIKPIAKDVYEVKLYKTIDLGHAKRTDSLFGIYRQSDKKVIVEPKYSRISRQKDGSFLITEYHSESKNNEKKVAYATQHGKVVTAFEHGVESAATFSLNDKSSSVNIHVLFTKQKIKRGRAVRYESYAYMFDDNGKLKNKVQLHAFSKPEFKVEKNYLRYKQYRKNTTQKKGYEQGYSCMNSQYQVIKPFQCDNVASLNQVQSSDVNNKKNVTELSCKRNLSVHNNLARTATASAQSTYCSGRGNDCYNASRVNDGNSSTQLGGNFSWTNDSSKSKELLLNWKSPKEISQIQVFTTKKLPVSDYDLYAMVNQQWVLIASMNGNQAESTCHAFEPVATKSIKLLGKKGPKKQRAYIRINEIVVH